ncbi:MAG TPA: LD-carboxypeptidase, partial [Microscillaceae bacterium]|nr:LD-carboxypeptidase [Microscillaceae bacterium]
METSVAKQAYFFVYFCIMITPPYLKNGDKIGIVAPATRVVSRSEMGYGIDILKQWGLQIELGEYIFAEYNQFAGTDAQRTADLQKMLDDPSIKAILCARGGYGTLRIIDQLNFDKFMQHPKWVVGFSDVTILHNHLHLLGLESIHGSMPLLFPRQTQATIDSLRGALFGQQLNFELPAHPYNRLGTAKGALIGGNLSLFVNSIGTPSQIDTQGKILFLEDVDEYLYHIDRLMIHLKRAGMLTGLAGLIVGQFTELMDDKVVPFGKDVNTIIAEMVSEYPY